jgi:hypothetical protein
MELSHGESTKEPSLRFDAGKAFKHSQAKGASDKEHDPIVLNDDDATDESTKPAQVPPKDTPTPMASGRKKFGFAR